MAEGGLLSGTEPDAAPPWKALSGPFFHVAAVCQCTPGIKSVWFRDILESVIGSVPLSSAICLFCQGYLTLSVWFLCPTLGAQDWGGGGHIFSGDPSLS